MFAVFCLFVLLKAFDSMLAKNMTLNLHVIIGCVLGVAGVPE